MPGAAVPVPPYRVEPDLALHRRRRAIGRWGDAPENNDVSAAMASIIFCVMVRPETVPVVGRQPEP